MSSECATMRASATACGPHHLVANQDLAAERLGADEDRLAGNLHQRRAAELGLFHFVTRVEPGAADAARGVDAAAAGLPVTEFLCTRAGQEQAVVAPGVQH